MKYLIAFFSIALLSMNGLAQKNRIIGFYNVENLFDTINSHNTNDAEFLPTSDKKWNSERYNEKLAHLAIFFDSLPEKPLFYGLCEVENKGVVEDLIKASKRLENFGVVHYESPDMRGIDVALIYDKELAKILYSKALNVTIPTESGLTRDILYVKTLVGKDTIHLFINHWPSRRGGQEKSEPNRLKAACVATLMIDSLLDANPKAKIIAMGDLNDYSHNMAPKLLAQFLNHTIDETSNKFGGTYNYRGNWGQLDHIFVSDNMMSNSKTSGIKMTQAKGTIFTPDFLLAIYRGTYTPFRFYAGSKYLGGYSDHLSVFIPITLP